MNQVLTFKWKEIIALALLNMAVAISWIAYHEYQPILLDGLNMNHMIAFLLLAKAFILVLIPPISGRISDYVSKHSGKFLTVYTIGISVTAMIFMIAATLISLSSSVDVTPIFPVVIILWVIAMNIFIAPANSMIQTFAPTKKIPVVMGVLFFATELVYALEPIIETLIGFFGATTTFIVGGVLIAVTGFYFIRISSDEAAQLKEYVDNSQEKQPFTSYILISLVGLFLGVGKAFLIEFIPQYIHSSNFDLGVTGSHFSFQFR